MHNKLVKNATNDIIIEGTGTEYLQLDDPIVDVEGWSNFVGFGDAADYAVVKLEHATSLALSANALDASKLIIYSYDGNNTRILLSRYDLASDRWTFGEDLSALFAQKPRSLSGLRVDGNGTLYAASDREVLILTPDGKKKGSVVPDMSSSGEISGLYASPDGRVFAAITYMNGNPETVEILGPSGTVGERIHIDGNMRDGDGEILFFCSEDDGVWGYRETADGIGKELLLDYVNSGILWSESRFVGAAI